MMKPNQIEPAFDRAKEQYAAFGVDAEAALRTVAETPLSLHCWQGDDVRGFETADAALGGGIAVTGDYPGRARNVDELRADLDFAYSLIPGRHRLNLHALYGEFRGARVDRDQIEPRHFTGWVEWARARGLPVDFNCSCFSHPLAATGYTISSFDERLRDFWIEHIKRCREIAAYLGRELGAPSLHNLWIPDGSKDATVFRHQHRDVLRGSLDEIFARDYPAEHLRDAVECKLFGLGSESYVVGSHEFYLGWALAHPEVLLCLDLGHFHPTESVADKISAVLLFVREILIHVSRGVRWDSDHVVIQNDDLTSLMQEIVRADALPRVRFATDFFDAELNRIGAWAVGARATLRTLLFALLEPTARLREFEAAGDYFGRLALLEEAKALPFGAVWDYFCRQQNVPVGAALIDAVHDYEQRVLRPRG